MTDTTLQSFTVKVTTSSGTILEGITDENGVVHLSPVTDGDSITIEVMENGYDDISQVVTVTNMKTYHMPLNPTDLKAIYFFRQTLN